MSKNISKRKNCIFVGGLPSEASEKVVRSYFQQFGEVKGVVLNKQKQVSKDLDSRSLQKEVDFGLFNSTLGIHRGCGFVEFANSQIVRSVTHIRDHYILGHKIDCRIAMTNNERKNYQKSIMSERRKVFIGKLPSGVDKDVVQAYFSRLGEIEEVTLIHKVEKNFGICFILFKEHFIGDRLVGRQFEILPGVFVECELALNPQQLHQRKLIEQRDEEEGDSAYFDISFPDLHEVGRREQLTNDFARDPLSGFQEMNYQQEQPSGLKTRHFAVSGYQHCEKAPFAADLTSKRSGLPRPSQYVPQPEPYIRSDHASSGSVRCQNTFNNVNITRDMASLDYSFQQPFSYSSRSIYASVDEASRPPSSNQSSGPLSRQPNLYLRLKGEMLEKRPKYFKLFA